MARRAVSWIDRLAMAGLILAEIARIRYTRKSTEDENRQVSSHERQNAECDKRFGPIDPRLVWSDDYTGTTFDRPGFQDLLDFCKANPRPRNSRGVIEMFSPSRFARLLDEDGKPDVNACMLGYLQLIKLNWDLRFCTLDLHGDPAIDIFLIANSARTDAAYSMDLSDNVSSGKRFHASNGWWVHSVPPFGAAKFDLTTNTVVKKGDSSSARGGNVILIRDEEAATWWEKAARRIIDGASLDSVGAWLYEKGVVGRNGGKLGHRHVKNILTNQALIGVVEYISEDAEGRTVRAVATTKRWGALVDIDLFRAVGAELERRSSNPRNRKRKNRGSFPLRPVCAHCGLEYHGGRNAKELGRGRTYTHPSPKERMDPEGFSRRKEAGCMAYSVDAEELEQCIKDLIVAQRSSGEFEDEIRRMILERDDARSRAEEAVLSARAEVVDRKKEMDRIAERVMLLTEEGFDGTQVREKLRACKAVYVQAQERLSEAEAFAQSREDAWREISRVIDETRNLAGAWDRLDDAGRKTLLDYWVLDVWIAAERIPGKRRANHKTGIVTLRTAPTMPQAFALGRQLSTADEISARTDASVSEARLARSAASASSEPMRPSAQAACSRTSGEESASAATSEGTPSGEPQLPNATATLRRKPGRPARRMGDPRENDSQASSSIDMRSIRDGDSVPGCETSEVSDSTPNGASPGPLAANDGSIVGVENFRVNGQTS
jgi:hypothetical protein